MGAFFSFLYSPGKLLNPASQTHRSRKETWDSFRSFASDRVREHAPHRTALNTKRKLSTTPTSNNNNLHTQQSCINQQHVNSVSSSDPFCYLKVHLHDMKTDMVGLVDTGSSVNVINKSFLLKSGGPKPNLNRPITVSLADGKEISVDGLIKLNISSPFGTTIEQFYVFENTSHPLILGIDFIRRHQVSLDRLIKRPTKTYDIRSAEAVTIAPGKELLVSGKFPFSVLIGTQGITETGKHCLRKKLLCARGIVTKYSHGRVPVKIYNPNTSDVIINKGDVIADLCPLDENTRIIPHHSISHISQKDQEPSYDSPASFVRINEITVSPTLTPAQKQDLNILLYDFRNTFLTKDNPALGYCDSVQLKIDLKSDAKPKYHKPYKLSPDKKQVLKFQLEHLLEQGIIAPLNESHNTPIVSPIILVEKRGVTVDSDTSPKERALAQYRFVVDFRFLNEQISDFKYQIPDMTDLTETFASAKPRFISKIDMSSSFFQLKIDEQSQKYTAFSTPFQTYLFKRVPQGLKVSANLFQLCMDKILSSSNLCYKSLVCYIDDVLLYHDNFDDHIRDLRELLQCITNAGLKLNPKKCSFATNECVFLGHKISQAGIQPPDDKLTAVRNYPRPKNDKELNRFLSFMGWFRKFIPNFASISFPLAALRKKGVKFVWSEECDHAFESLKSSLLNSSALSHPRSDVDYIISVDSSSKGVGYMLYYLLPQNESKGLSERERVRVIKFGSRTLKSYQQSYSPCKLELLGMTSAVLDLADYIRGRKTKILCDHQALQPLLNKQCRGAIFSRWAAILQQFDLTVEYKPAAEMIVADALSRCHSDPKPDLTIQSPDDDDDPFFPYVTENPTSVTFPNGTTLDKVINVTPNDMDSNPEVVNFVASIPVANRFSPLTDIDTLYDADASDADSCIVSTSHLNKSVRKAKVRKSKCSGPPVAPLTVPPNCQTQKDSNVYVSDATHLFSQMPSYNECNAVRSDLPIDVPNDVAIEANSVPNDVAIETNSDDVSTEIYYDAFEYQCPEISEQDEYSSAHKVTLENLLETALKNNIQSINEFQKSDLTPEKIEQLQNLDPDLAPMIKYLSKGILPKSQKLSRVILVKCSDYILVDNVLFHKDRQTLKRDKLDSGNYQLVLPKIMQREVIQMYHDSPLAGHAGISITIDKIRKDYFFERMCTVVTDYVKSCDLCQRRKVSRHTKNPTTALPTPEHPFEAWEIDLFGILPLSSQGYCYVFIATDMFSRYQYAVPLRSKDSVSVSNAIFNLCCTFGTPRVLYSDFGAEMTASVTSQICQLLGVPQRFAPAFCHFIMGKNERSHLDLARRLTPFTNSNKNNWDKYLHAVVFSMNSSVNSTLGFSPYEIVFGMKARFPLSSPMQMFDISAVPKEYKSYIKHQSDILDTIRNQVRLNTESAHAKMCEKANANINPLSVTEGDFVYLSANHSDIGSKLDFKYQGPFVIDKVNSPHIVTLKDVSNNSYKHNIHVNRLKPAHVRMNNPRYADDHPELFPPLASRSMPHPSPTVPEDNHTMVSSADKKAKHTPRRSVRLKSKPSPLYSMHTSSTETDTHKVRKFIGQKKIQNVVYYLVHLKGESSNDALWLPYSSLNAAAKAHVRLHPPPQM